MRVRSLGYGIRGDVAKLSDTALVVERFPAFPRQHYIKRRKCFASIRVPLLRFFSIESGPNNSNESVWWNRGARVRLSKHLFQPTGDPCPSSGAVMDVIEVAIFKKAQ